MLRRFALIAVSLAASLFFAAPAYADARDTITTTSSDDVTTQRQHAPRADVLAFAANTPSPAVTVPTPVLAPDENVVSPLTMIVTAIFVALSSVLGWAIRKLGVSWGASATSTVLADLALLADNALDLAHSKVNALVVPLAADKLHGTIVEEAFDILWPIASKEIAHLGWSDDSVKVWLSSLLAPTAPGTSTAGVHS